MEQLQPFLSVLSSPIVIGVLILAFIIYFITIMRSKKNRAQQPEEDEEWQIYWSEFSDLTSEQYRKIAIGAIYSQQQEAYINSLTTGLSRERVNEIVNNWWHIHSSDEAMQQLNYLRDKGFEYYFPFVYQAFLTNDEEKKKEVIIDGIVPHSKNLSEEEEEIITHDIQKAYGQQKNLAEAYDELIEAQAINNKEDIKKYGVVGWDCGRLNFLARLCYDAGYITDEQAWYFIDEAHKKAQKTFDSWEDFAKSYVIGRAIWAGQDSDNLWIGYYGGKLLSDPKSPWNELEW